MTDVQIVPEVQLMLSTNEVQQKLSNDRIKNII